MALQLPNLSSRLVNAALQLVPPWNSFFQQFTNQPSNIMTIDVGVSPFEYNALEPGMLVISGGTVSGVDLIRGSVTIPLGATATNFMVGKGDFIVIIYSVMPTINFVPFYSTVPSQ